MIEITSFESKLWANYFRKHELLKLLKRKRKKIY